MASLYCKNQEKDPLFTNARYGRSCSKAQACLQKILHLISTVPPPAQNNSNPFNKRGVDVDLNLSLGSVLDDSEEKSDCVAENSFIEDKTATATATATDASSEVTDVQKSEEVKTAASEEAAFNDSLGLLIEAAEMIAYMDCCLNGKEKEIPFQVEGFEEIEDTAAPVVRSKRGRSQVLPLRYRDSVLEPWMKRPQRSTAAAVVSKKKRTPSSNMAYTTTPSSC